MIRTTKEGITVKIEKQFRNQSHNYIDNDRRIFADLFKVRYNDGKIGILCSTEME